MRPLALLAALLGGIGALAAAEPVRDIVSQVGERQGIAVTIYNDNLALIKDRRRVQLPGGLTRLAIRDVSSQMRPETAILRAVQGPPIGLVEQNFDFDLLTPGKLLDKYVGREVSVIRTHPTTGAETREVATVLSNNEGAVLRFADRIETGVPGRLAFAAVPANLRDRPTLSVLLDATGGARELELAYLSGGLGWKADYVANLAADGRTLDLSGWVTLSNESGASYEDALLQLVAGSVNRVRPRGAPVAMPAQAMKARSAVQEAQQEALFEYHLYSFEQPTTIAQNQSKQVALLSASAVPVRREYLLAGAEYYYRERYGQIGQRLKPAVFVEFDNRGGTLGKPLPGGIVRVYARDSRDRAQFIGEDAIEHTAKNEKVRLRLGEAFDITADRTQTNYRKLADNLHESSYRIEIRNAKDEAVTVRVLEPVPGDWEIVGESHKHSKESSRRAAWNVEVAGGGKSTLEYTVRVKF